VAPGRQLLFFSIGVYPIRKFDFIACPPGGREVAHQMINTGKVDLKYLALSTKIREEIAEYPDSDKVGIFIGDYGDMEYRKLFKAGEDVLYLTGETAERLRG
jgi:uncharacterized cupin superfamily protein